MRDIILSKGNNIHFMGIGGISMSGLAEIAINLGMKVSGSDSHETELTDHLTSLGALISYSQTAENITDGIDLLVYTSAISSDNEELKAAKNKGIPCISRGVFLGHIMKQYKSAIAISGTDGKTTTTSMISHIFLKAESDPTIMVGGMLPIINGNLRIGKSDTFITEACEYTNTFLSFYPTTAVILNIREDHLDFFKDIDDIRHSFKEFASLLPDNGLLVINGDIDNLEYFTNDLSARYVTVGLKPHYDYYADNIVYDEYGRPSFSLYRKNAYIADISLGVMGIHNVYNALSAIAVGLEAEIPISTIKEAISEFSGTDWRLQILGKVNGATLIDDYAHNPDEIHSSLEALTHYKHNKVLCVFQPHTYTRTKSLLREFAKELSVADHVVLADIYPAREEDIYNISSIDLKKAIEATGKECTYFKSFDEITDFVKKSCSQGDIIIVMGAGDIRIVAKSLMNK